MRRCLLLLALELMGCRSAPSALRPTTTTPPEQTAGTLATTTSTASTTAPATTTTTTTAVRPTSTSAPARSVPTVISVQYAQQVAATIYHLVGDATRHAYAVKALDAEFDDRLQPLYGGGALADARGVFKDALASNPMGFADPPRDPTVRVVQVVSSSATCMVLRTMHDLTPLFKTRSNQALGQIPNIFQMTATTGIGPFNPTGWGIVSGGDPAEASNLNICH